MAVAAVTSSQSWALKRSSTSSTDLIFQTGEKTGKKTARFCYCFLNKKKGAKISCKQKCETHLKGKKLNLEF